ncbi:MAG TPA: hypothetical protein VFW96_10295 [Thermomicrobiales bacterium]|nr:hypothetical protein [Thermomicrobiales bacterium]
MPPHARQAARRPRQGERPFFRHTWRDGRHAGAPDGRVGVDAGGDDALGGAAYVVRAPPGAALGAGEYANQNAPRAARSPGPATTRTVLGRGPVGDGVRDALDTRRRER